MINEDLEQQIRTINGEINDYLETVLGLTALCHEIRWDDSNRVLRSNVPYHLGRRMTTSNTNRVQPNEDVNPDLIVQPNADYGLVVEARLRFPKDDDQRKKKVRQLEKYDDDLEGWYTENERISQSDVMLLTHESDAVDTTDYIDNMIKNGEAHFDRQLSVIGCIRSADRYEVATIRVRKAYGKVSDTDLDIRLHSGRDIYLETILTYQTDLYDHRPHLAHMMYVIWMKVFPALIEQDQYVESRPSGNPIINTTADSLTDYMRRMYNPDFGSERVPGFPRQEWVREALDALCSLKYASRIGNEYNVNYKFIKDPKASFVKGLCRLELKLELKEEKRKLKFVSQNTQQLKLNIFD